MRKNDLEVEEGLKSIAKSSLIVFIGVLLSKIFTYLYRITIARYFSPEIYGIFSLAIMILSFFVAFASIGLQEGLLRYIPLYRGKKKGNKIKFIINFSLIFVALASIIFSIILFVFSDFIAIKLFHIENLSLFLKIFSFVIPLSVFSGIFLHIIKAFEKIGAFSFISNILQGFLKIFLLIIFIYLGYNTNSIIFSYALTFVIITICAYSFYKLKISKNLEKSELTKKEKIETSKNLLSYSWPIMFTGIITSIFMWTDSFFIGYFMGASDVGIYNAAVPLVGLLFVLPTIFVQLFFPLITREFSIKKYKVIEELSKQVAKWIFIFNLPLFIIMALFPGAFINLFFGKEYLFAESALRILTIGGFIASISLISNYLISMLGKSKLLLVNLIIVSLINVLLNIILIPKLGLIGAAISTTIVWIILNVTLLIEVKHFMQIIPLRRKMIKIFLISLIPLMVLIFIKNILTINFIGLILLGSLFVLLYFFLILILGGLDKNDLLILNIIKEKISKK